MRPSTILLFVVGVCTSAQWSHAQDQPAGASQHLTYSVKHGSAKNLAPVLAKHFKGVAEIQAVADSPENALLISAPPAVLKEVVAVLGQLDRKPRQIAIDVWAGVVFADGAAPKAADAAAAQRKEPDQQLDLGEFTGPVAKVLPKLAALKASGRAGQWKHFQGTALENQVFSVNDTEVKPSVTSMTVTATGKVLKSSVRRSTGLVGKMTCLVMPDSSVQVDLQLSHSRAEDGKLLGIENGMPVHETQLAVVGYKSRVIIASGYAAALQAVTESRAAGTGQTLLVISARVVEPGDPKAK